MRRYRAVLFDVDGTILDTSEGLRASLMYATQEMKLPPLTEVQIRDVLSAPVHRALRKFYNLSEAEAVQMATLYRDAYRDRFFSRFQVFPGIVSLLDELRGDGYLLASATLKRESFCKDLFAQTDLLRRFTVIAGQNQEYTLKKKDIILNAIARLNLSDPREAVLVGDSAYDAEGAADAGIDFIAVTYGFGFTCAEDLKDYATVGCAHTPQQVAEQLRK